MKQISEGPDAASTAFEPQELDRLWHQIDQINTPVALDTQAPAAFAARTAEQENAHRNLQRAFLSWERTLQKTPMADRPEVLRNALRELLPIGELAGVGSDVAAWAAD